MTQKPISIGDDFNGEGTVLTVRTSMWLEKGGVIDKFSSAMHFSVLCYFRDDYADWWTARERTSNEEDRIRLPSIEELSVFGRLYHTGAARPTGADSYFLPISIWSSMTRGYQYAWYLDRGFFPVNEGTIRYGLQRDRRGVMFVRDYVIRIAKELS